MFSAGDASDRVASLGADEPSLLAFAGADEEACLISATSRCPFRANDGVLLNVECFGPVRSDRDDGVAAKANECYNETNHGRSLRNADEWPLLLYAHGICESAETHGVQTLAQHCATHGWRLVVLELAGHGLSGDVDSGRSGGLFGASSEKGRATCPSFDPLVNHVVEFAMHAGRTFPNARGMVLCGGSLGGALVAYAVKGILEARRDIKANQPEFYGIALLAPALGIHPEALPSSPLILALKTLSHVLPSQGILTPVEHPTYALPASSTRNFSGRWPLSTSNMLLDLTARRVPHDVTSNHVSSQLEGLPSLCVMIGDRDEIVPVQSVLDWFESAANMGNEEKTLVVLQGAGHDFFHERSDGRQTRGKGTAFAERLFEWLNGLARRDSEDK